MPRAANGAVLSGILTRIVQSNRDSELIDMCVLALQCSRHCHLEGHLRRQLIAQAQFRAREEDDANAVGALANQRSELVRLPLDCFLCP